MRPGSWLRLRTVIVVRWAAAAGQTLAVLVAVFAFGIRFQFGLASLVIAVSVIANIALTFLYPRTRRLSERGATLMLAFDVVQLGALLAVTGGIDNPFALLILAPVTIAASALPLRQSGVIAALALAVIAAISLWHLPIRTAAGEVLALPPIFRLGFWLALTVGVLFLAVYARQVMTEIHDMRLALTATQLALAREQQLTALGGVVAAAAHEMGTPLATIKLVSSELVTLLADQPELREDAELIRSQTDRCRDILRSMGRAGKDDLHLQSAPFETVVREAAEPHVARGREVVITAMTPGRQPLVRREAGVIHGLRNLVQNAVDFAGARVEIELSWDADEIAVRIEDDGPGFPPQVLARIGDPFLRRRPSEGASGRPGYEGMGLGLFIAKTLLERTGARLDFASGAGAIVVVRWPVASITALPGAALGENRPLSP
ncbi:MAG: ActS/PrrB/RegB family redox-sensitive histidine kinase [Rubellimicrobium sp.]|nr:ActS/PrrB/RegB family redox-sensitive histidine kinase [Rubellimicrobium sp.]